MYFWGEFEKILDNTFAPIYMPARVHAMTTIGMDPLLVEVEVDISPGKPGFTVVGLADIAIQEARERVRSAIKNSKLKFSPHRITANLAPADVRKAGPLFDLPIAMGILLASGQISDNEEIQKSLFIGELALNGNLRKTAGVLPIAARAKEKGFTQIFLPAENAKEASLIEGIEVFALESLTQMYYHFLGSDRISPFVSKDSLDVLFEKNATISLQDFAHIKGQQQAKRALEIAAAGSHNVLMNGSPGSGKTLMAKAFQGILPRMTLEEAFSVSKIYSIANLLPSDIPLITSRPFRIVHHTASNISIVGGGKNPNPGEISLAHKGVLFLDEIAEFPPAVLEVLRQPLEDRTITVSRASGSYTFPAHFSLLAAMNPCPCGYYNVPNSTKDCNCTPQQITKYQKRLSGPLLDRIDIYIEVSPVPFKELSQEEKSASSDTIRKRVQMARDIQNKRYQKQSIACNSEMGIEDIKTHCILSTESKQILEMAVKQMHLSARSYNRILKVARTIADLEQSDTILPTYIAEALQYRKKETL